jgi:hypothetical protein
MACRYLAVGLAELERQVAEQLARVKRNPPDD